MPALLQIEDLNVSFQHEEGKVDVLQQLSLDIFPGEMVAVVGESGSGKSMTALSIMRLLPPGASMTGKILLDPSAVNLTEVDEATIRKIRGGRIAMIFQEPMTSLNPLMRCGEQLMEAIQLHQQRTDQKICEDLLAKTGLFPVKEIMEKFPHQLSGGQRQRIMIAMALAGNPSLLIADEPTTALDPVIQHSILELIQKLQKELSLSVLLITHDLAVAADFADRMIIMENGKVIESGSTAEIFLHPKKNYTRSLMKKKGFGLPPVAHDSESLKTTDDEKSYPAKEIFIKVENLSAVHINNHFSSKKEQRTLDGISFQIEKNEILGLVGESGSGKSTLARILAGLMKAESGSISIEGKNLENYYSENKAVNRGKIQLIFQDPYGSLNPRLTIGKAIREVLRKHSGNLSRDSIEKKNRSLLLEVGLKEELSSRYPHELSGGQRQRVCIARALACSPSLLIFDESLSALDTGLQDEILTLILRLQKEFGFSALFISHDLAMVCRISRRILVLQQGKLVEETVSEGFFRHQHHPYTNTLIESMPGKKIRSMGMT